MINLIGTLRANKSAVGSVVQVMHQTVREFFRPNGPTAQSVLRMDGYDAHERISITCMRYLILCVTNIPSICLAAGGENWTSESFEAYAQYLSERPFFNYALEYVKRHLQQRRQVAGYAELISQLHTKLNKSPVAFIFTNWIFGHEQQGHGNHSRAELLHAAARKRYSQVVEALLIAGAEVEACRDGKTLLMVAAESGDLATDRKSVV